MKKVRCLEKVGKSRGRIYKIIGICEVADGKSLRTGHAFLKAKPFSRVMSLSK